MIRYGVRCPRVYWGTFHAVRRKPGKWYFAPQRRFTLQTTGVVTRGLFRFYTGEVMVPPPRQS